MSTFTPCHRLCAGGSPSLLGHPKQGRGATSTMLKKKVMWLLLSYKILSDFVAPVHEARKLYSPEAIINIMFISTITIMEPTEIPAYMLGS